MITVRKPVFALTARDLMNPAVVTIPQEMSLQAAARSFAAERISGAPVVDAEGHYVGVLSTTDLLAWAERARRGQKCAGVYSDWQVGDILPREDVGLYMTDDPVTVDPETSIRRMAQMMIDADIHRLIVVGEAGRPIGIVSSTDLLAALATAEDGGD
jgi:CBS domain-containing protein